LVKIRLKRIGATKRPFYRLVVADSRSPRDGRFIEEIGVYDPLAQPAKVVIDADRVRDWMRKGARPSDTARKILELQGILKRTAPPPRAPAAAKAAAEPPPVAAAPDDAGQAEGTADVAADSAAAESSEGEEAGS
jgi:small subunit ribosomal protein S16